MRASDRRRVEEICAGVWDGHDYIPDVFDDWLSDPAADFQAAERDGFVVGVQRLRRIGPHLAWYEGLRVAAEARRQGVAREMLRQVVAQARQENIREIRLATADPEPRALFESEGFHVLVAADAWDGTRIEGGDPPRIPSPAEAPALMERVAAEGGLPAYGGVNADPEAALDLTAGELARLAGEGRLRVGPGGRGLAAVRPGWGGRSIWVTFLSGKGAALRELLLALRYEADAADLRGATLLLPESHPGISDAQAVGYDVRRDPFRLFIYALRI